MRQKISDLIFCRRNNNIHWTNKKQTDFHISSIILPIFAVAAKLLRSSSRQMTFEFVSTHINWFKLQVRRYRSTRIAFLSIEMRQTIRYEAWKIRQGNPI